MSNKELLSEERLDFLREMMNIGAGNAATALSQMLRCAVEVKAPAVYSSPIPEVPPILGDPSLPTVCVKMGMVGDVAGGLFFIVPDEHKKTLIHLMERAMPGPSGKSPDLDISLLAEVGNVVAGVYLTAIHDFCKLRIYHTVPTLAVDMIQSLLDESLVGLSLQSQAAILVETEFAVEEHRIRTFLLMIPSVESLTTLVDSIEQARIA